MNFILFIYRNIKFALLKLRYEFLVFLSLRTSNKLFFHSENNILFITHNWGGGTKLFETNYQRGISDSFVICRMISYRKNICLRIERNGNVKYMKPEKINQILENSFKEIIINSLASFYEIQKYIFLFSSYRDKNVYTKLIYMIHDFHCVCPNFNLIAENWNCNLNCTEHKCKFIYFKDKFIGSIIDWRNIWNKFFLSVDEIRCFSESSKTIIRKAYENLPDEIFRVLPHDMDYCNFYPIHNIEKKTLHIGIVGSVYSVPKGKLVVQELLRLLPEELPISIIGATKKQIGMIRRNNTNYLGKYRQADLQKIVEREEISLIVFPSIWPETFSYLVSEQIAMDIPIICFDMGAQAEKVRAYRRGIVVQNISEMVKKIIEFRMGNTCK